ncbi:hypothetical protein TNCV_2594161 [Trichonephila clavipes]|nr:hypothetical protein TNCV_2594161 [Trichonephila clavipes]
MTPLIKIIHSKFSQSPSKSKNTTYSSANRRAPKAVRTPAASDPEHGDGTPPRTEVLLLAQHPIRELPLLTRERRVSLNYTPTQHATISCYPIGQAVNQPEAPIGRRFLQIGDKSPDGLSAPQQQPSKEDNQRSLQ